MKRICLALGGLVLAAGVVTGPRDTQAAISYSTAGSAYSQDFNSLPMAPQDASIQATMPWADDTTSAPGRTSIPGWYLYHPIVQATEGGTNTHQRMRIGSGAGTTGAFMSYGPGITSNERALGALNSDTMSTPQNAAVPPATQEESQMYVGLLLSNDTGQTLTSFSLAYIGEQWRKAGNAAGVQVTEDGLDFQYSLDPLATISSPNAMYTDVNALDFASPVTSGAGGTLDGNAAANRTALSAVVNDINWAPGGQLLLRWVDTNYPGPDPSAGTTRADNGVAIDDLVFSAEAAIPEPASFALIGLAALGMMRRRR